MINCIPHKEKILKRKKECEENLNSKVNKELQGCTFRPQFVSQTTYEKSMMSHEKPKGFTQIVERMRKGIIQTMEKKYLIKK